MTLGEVVIAGSAATKQSRWRADRGAVLPLPDKPSIAIAAVTAASAPPSERVKEFRCRPFSSLRRTAGFMSPRHEPCRTGKDLRLLENSGAAAGMSPGFRRDDEDNTTHDASNTTHGASNSIPSHSLRCGSPRMAQVLIKR